MSYQVSVQEVPQAAVDAAVAILQAAAANQQEANLHAVLKAALDVALRKGLRLQLVDQGHPGERDSEPLMVELTLRGSEGIGAIDVAVYDWAGEYFTEVYVEYQAGQLRARTWNADEWGWDATPSSDDVLLTREQVQTLRQQQAAYARAGGGGPC